MRSSPATEVPGVDVAALARYLPDVLDDYDPEGELSARLRQASPGPIGTGCCAGRRSAHPGTARPGPAGRLAAG
ncbi:MAG: hypothetical protein JWL68_4679 [Actinomycetia bacterium]|nr:hypothetical protein [Actinomycetes bacterium]